MINLKFPAAFLLLGSSWAFASSPTYQYAISTNSLGIGQTISVSGSTPNGFQTNDGGGMFLGTLTGTSQSGLLNPNNAVAFWCVDDQEAFNGGGQSGLANVTLLAGIDKPGTPGYGDGNGTLTHYGTIQNAGANTWTNNGTVGSYAGDAATAAAGLSAANTAADRYTLAAYLVMQYQGFDQSINGGVDANEDNAIQNAIWSITNTTLPVGGPIFESGYNNLAGTTGGANVDSVAYWVNQALAHVADVNQQGWAVVSWGAQSDGTLNHGAWYDGANATNQTFLVELTGQPGLITGQTTPEPGFYGALAIGLGGLFFAVRRRRNA